MGLFRRKQETLNERLLREAGLESSMLGETPPPGPLEPPPSVISAMGLPHDLRLPPKDWDATALTLAPGLVGKWVEFTTLPNGDVIVDEEEGSADLSPLADAIEEQLSPPYRAAAAVQAGGLWGVGAKRIQVAEIPFSYGSKLELSRNGDDEELRVDGEPSDETIPPELEEFGSAVGENFFAEAERIDGDSWEVRATAL